MVPLREASGKYHILLQRFFLVEWHVPKWRVSDVFRQKTDEKVFAKIQRKFKIAKTYILFVGIISPYKNFEMLLKVLGKIDKKVQLVVAGEVGTESMNIKDQIDSYKERVKGLGQMQSAY